MLKLIVAHDLNNVIGWKGNMPWHISNDLKRVKQITTGETIVMGRGTFESLGKPLPNRTNVVLTSNKTFNNDHQFDIEVIHSIEDLNNYNSPIIFGGGNLYQQVIDQIDEMYITLVHEKFIGDTFFPEYNLEDFEIISSEKFNKNKNESLTYEHLHLKKKYRKKK
ncbi:dihydrofolate reductase [Abyssicoccus albus]|uniref:Dihydrofolate reductase n=1 Tax=Abyssicoccus albus TaxID=1817405 RepID=A0A3N5BN40_9BACL|nr:dihydrofolate reductase [Abyssicoccus albus]RPF57989.1 dihydrofolate reductase [Abyssicoccus albus]